MIKAEARGANVLKTESREEDSTESDTLMEEESASETSVKSEGRVKAEPGVREGRVKAEPSVREEPIADDDATDWNDDEEVDEDVVVGDDENLNDDLCDVCAKTGQLLMCEGSCLRSFHLECINKLTFPPQNRKWICIDCKHSRHACFVCDKYGTDGDDVFKCKDDRCGKYYHTECLKGITKDPSTVKKIRTADAPTLVSGCPRHYCNRCSRAFGDDKRVKCFRCFKVYHKPCAPGRKSFVRLFKLDGICIDHVEPEEDSDKDKDKGKKPEKVEKKVELEKRTAITYKTKRRRRLLSGAAESGTTGDEEEEHGESVSSGAEWDLFEEHGSRARALKVNGDTKATPPPTSEQRKRGRPRKSLDAPAAPPKRLKKLESEDSDDEAEEALRRPQKTGLGGTSYTGGSSSPLPHISLKSESPTMYLCGAPTTGHVAHKQPGSRCSRRVNLPGEKCAMHVGKSHRCGFIVTITDPKKMKKGPDGAAVDEMPPCGRLVSAPGLRCKLHQDNILRPSTDRAKFGGSPSTVLKSTSYSSSEESGSPLPNGVSRPPYIAGASRRPPGTIPTNKKPLLPVGTSLPIPAWGALKVAPLVPSAAASTSSPATQSEEHIVKCFQGESCVKIDLGLLTDLDALKRQITKSFPNLKSKSYKTFYIDADGDKVQLQDVDVAGPTVWAEFRKTAKKLILEAVDDDAKAPVTSASAPAVPADQPPSAKSTPAGEEASAAPSEAAVEEKTASAPVLDLAEPVHASEETSSTTPEPAEPVRASEETSATASEPVESVHESEETPAATSEPAPVEAPEETSAATPESASAEVSDEEPEELLAADLEEEETEEDDESS